MIRFGYFGQFFHGLQPQKDVPTAGAALRDLITQAAGQPPKALCFAARTDKGVHAIGNIATFWFKAPFNIQSFLENLAGLQVPGLRDIQCFEVDRHTHARGSSAAKRYRYALNGPDEQTSWQIIPERNLDAMREALTYILGEHDFSSFRTSGCTAGTPVKTIYEAIISPSPDSGEGLGVRFPSGTRSVTGGVYIDLYGDAFLRQMIRILVGVLCEIGTGLRKPEDMKVILEAKSRQAAGITAPACGLTLLSVELKGLGALET
ncbi:MAG: hypothetical protein WCK42_06190 [Myxococcaceae bacterium]